MVMNFCVVSDGPTPAHQTADAKLPLAQSKVLTLISCFEGQPVLFLRLSIQSSDDRQAVQIVVLFVQLK